MGMIMEARTVVYMKSKVLYHVIPFIGFVGAVMLHETLTTKLVAKYVGVAWLQPYIGYLLVYLLAIHLFPIIAYVIVKQVIE